MIYHTTTPEGGVNSGGYTPRREASRYIYPPIFTDPEGDSCFSIYQIGWIIHSWLSDFQHFNWLAGHRLSGHLLAVPNMLKERVSNKKSCTQFCSSEKK